MSDDEEYLAAFQALVEAQFPGDAIKIGAVVWIEGEYMKRLRRGSAKTPAAMRRNAVACYWWDDWMKVREAAGL